MKTSKSLHRTLLLYCVLFFGIWAVFELWFRDVLDGWAVSVGVGEWILQLLKSGVIKNLVWTLPAFWLMGHFAEEMHISRKEMLTQKVNWLKWLPWIGLFLLYAAAAAWVNHGRIGLSPEWKPTDLIWIAFVGITEESVFRGWLLNSTVKEGRTWQAVLVNALLFLAIHFPKWISEGIFVYAFTSFGFLEVMALSVLFSWSFLKTRSLAVPVVLHVLYDLFVVIIG
ncbi:MAG: CPBP family intramembrane metalloprotease [Oscillospiraceae bacterium]|nr:CPBP family intramembrane metalloprotease [Oscillospiraceae bacterium]